MLTGIPNILSSHLISFQRELKNWLVSNLASSINVFSGSNEDLLAQDFKGANSLITSGGSPLRMEVRIFFSCSVQGMDIVLKSKLKFLLKRAAGS